jgi:anti-sigma regulatory factor (Ser/Thr protein kinase)
MTAHPLPLAGSVASDLCCRWMAPAMNMAAAASAVHVPAADRAAAGWAAAHGASPPRVATRTPGLDARSVGAAREFSVATMRRWGVANRVDDIGIVVSELLTNALRHGVPDTAPPRRRWPLRLGLVQPGRYVLCAVADPGRRLPEPKAPDYLAESGRGLHVISALSDAWGCTTPTEAGKVVWAVFSVQFSQPPAPVRWPAGYETVGRYGL